MTETATEQTTKTDEPLVFQDAMQEMQYKTISEMIVRRNELVGRANAAQGDRVTLTEQIRDNSTDPEIVRLREAIAEYVLELDALVKPQVDKIVEDSQGSTEEIEKELKELDATLKPGVNFFKKLYDGHAAVEALPKQERLQGTSVRSGGSGTKRIRGFNVIVTYDGKDQEFENFTSAAKYLGVDTADLQAAFFAKAGVDEAKNAPDVVNMVVNFEQTDSEGNKTEESATVKAYRTEAADAAAASDEGDVTEPEGDSDVTESDLEGLV